MGSRKESQGKDVTAMRASDERRGELRRKEDDGNESTGVKEEKKPRRRWLDTVRMISKRRD